MTNKEAIIMLTHNYKYRELIDNVYQYEALYLAIKALENERPKGTWKDSKIRDDIIVSYAIRCSICLNDSGLGFHANFCPYCGADMRGGKNDKQ